MHRFFLSSQNISGNLIALSDKDQLHHLKVLRIKADEELMLFDDLGNEYFCRIKESQKDKIILEIKDKKLNSNPNRIKLTISCAIPKKSKFDDIVDKLTQLGVDTIIPLLTERVIVRWGAEKKILQQRRWEKIALNSVKQSQRNTLPLIEPIQEIKEVLKNLKSFDLKLIPHLNGKRKSLGEVLSNSKARNILVFIGPEGDFTADEVGLALKKGCIPVDLGETVLRVETAAVVVASFIRLYC